jgi:hypothetical protein
VLKLGISFLFVGCVVWDWTVGTAVMTRTPRGRRKGRGAIAVDFVDRFVLFLGLGREVETHFEWRV